MTKPNDVWKVRYSHGCELCGRRIPSLPAAKGYDYSSQGLEQAHIFAKQYGPLHDWNILLVCPTCHAVFDGVIKPKLRQAFVKAVGGFRDPPTDTKSPKLKVGVTYKQAIERMIEPKKAQGLDKLPEEEANDGAQIWNNETVSRKKRYAKKA